MLGEVYGLPPLNFQ